MKLVKSLLLGSAALVAAAAGAQAADLPFRKAAPVDYVRVCDWTGTGYFYIPGTDTCLKIGGFIYAEYAYVTGGKSVTPTPGLNASNFVTTPSRVRAQSGFFLRGQLDADARTQTAYGTLRTYVRYRIDRKSGTYNAGTGVAFGSGPVSTNGVNGSNTAYLDKGFIQFAGITAGRVQSFFDFYADNYNFDGIANSDQSNQVLAYTANFAGGFSATLSMEDRDTRNIGIGNIAFGNTGMPNMVGANAVYAGQTIPDFVGSLNVDQAWGRAQLSGAYHDVNTVAVIGGPNGLASSQTESGWALNAGIMVKLPMLAAGDELWLEGGYMNGAISYQEESGNLNSGFYGQLVPGFQHIDVDAVAVANPNRPGYSLQLPTGFHVLAGLKHYWTPQFHTFTFGSYEEIGYGNIVKNIDWTRGGIGDASEFRVGNQFIFTPVNNLDIGVEVMYARIDQTLAHERGQLATALPPGVAKNGDVFTTRLKLERDF